MPNLYGLNNIQFAERDTAIIEQSIIGGFERAWEESTGEKLTLYPGDPRRLFLLTVAAVIVQQRNLIDYTGKQNLLAFAGGDYLEHIGLLLGVRRLVSRPAYVTVRFKLSTALAQTYIIPAGTRCTPEGKLYFATFNPAEVAPGQTQIDVPCRCLADGVVGNGYLPGQISKLVDPLPWVQEIANITKSEGGADTEQDESLRSRIQLAPESFSVAGPRGAYEFWARSASAPILDVAVVGPPELEPGYVEIYPLLEGGRLPTQDILDLVYGICNAEDIRPLTDHVSVLSPVAVDFNLSVKYWIRRMNSTQTAAIHAAVEKAVAEWALWQRSKIGRDIIPSRLVQLIMSAGAKRVEVVSPAFTPLSYKQIAIMHDPPQVIYGGLEDD